LQVIGGIYRLTWPHIKAIKLVPVSEQVFDTTEASCTLKIVLKQASI